MCRLPVTFGKPELKSGDEPSGDVSGIIGFSGDAAGSVILHFSFDVAAKIASQFAGVEMTETHPDFADAIGELANMIAGGAKSQFEGLRIDISLPSVVIGPKHNVSRSKDAPRIVVPCRTDAGTFHAEIGMLIGKRSEPANKKVTVGAAT